MKKSICLLLTAAMCLSLAACSDKKNTDVTNTTDDSIYNQSETSDNITASDSDESAAVINSVTASAASPTEANNNKPANNSQANDSPNKPTVPVAPSVTTTKASNSTQKATNPAKTTQPVQTTQASAKTTGEKIRSNFRSAVKTASKAYSIALLTFKSTDTKVSGKIETVSEGYLAGFKNKISGFSEGVVYKPRLGSTPFIGYIFILDDATDGDAFVKTLKDNADPAWQICELANETVVDRSDKTVMFVMCP